MEKPFIYYYHNSIFLINVTYFAPVERLTHSLPIECWFLLFFFSLQSQVPRTRSQSIERGQRGVEPTHKLFKK